jgi:hypothetical protein
MGIKAKKESNTGGGERATGTADNNEHRFDTSKPQFRKKPSRDAKIELDDRFKSVLTDPRFQLQTADRYGRKSQKSKSKTTREDLGEFYAVKDETITRNNTNSIKTQKGDAEKEAAVVPHNSSNTERFKLPQDSSKHIPKQILTALSRGDVQLSSSSDEENDDVSIDESDEGDGDLDNLVVAKETLGVLDPSFKDGYTNHGIVDFTTAESPYLAVMNADWAHFRAVDIFAIISSFVPPGTVRRVSVYPSNFGMERLQKEELFGPEGVWTGKTTSNNKGSDDSVSEDEIDDDSFVEDSKWNKGDDDGCSEADIERNDGHSEAINSDFDPEKLRLYEASRLKYYFAVVEFANHQFADIAYKEVDGMEFEHSSAALDLRIIPVDEISVVIENRNLRDEASGLPSNYSPPDFVVNALQQSAVQCTWDMGDHNRESLLTKYTVSGQAWGQLSECDELKVYIASDQSSDDEESVSEKKKSRKLRNKLGLGSDNDDDDDDNNSDDENAIGSGSAASSSDSDDNDKYTMEATFVPGKLTQSSDHEEPKNNEMTPWEKYQDKRRQKRSEKRTASREKRKQINEERKKGGARSQREEDDDFFVEQIAGDPSIEEKNQIPSENDKVELEVVPLTTDKADDDEMRDFDIRGIKRIEKNKQKQLKGARKRKEDRLAANVAGTDFQIDTTDTRFQAVLEGTDERFGIDRTDPNFKETPAMHHILKEQTRHRKKQRKLTNDSSFTSSGRAIPDVNVETMKPTSGSIALSALVSSIKSKVSR